MSATDSLIFANLTLLAAAVNRSVNNAFPSPRLITEMLRLIPTFGLFSFVVYKLLKKPLKIVFALVRQKLPPVKQSPLTCCSGHKDDTAQDEELGNTERNHDEAQLPDRIVHPELYDVQENQPTY